ncbi:MAG: hypothetical protein ACREQ9_12325 [Candidatus Binatia bacterium]
MNVWKILGAVAALVMPALPAAAGSRVIVSATLNDTLLFFDAQTLVELQPPLPSKGGGPVRLWVQDFGERTYLFAANHGVVTGSVGVFDLSGDLVTELPLSPFPARPGSVGIAAGDVHVGDLVAPMVFVTNTWFALGPCSMPAGSVTAYDASLLGDAGLLQEIGTADVAGAIPYAVSVDGEEGLAFASGNCTATLDTMAVERNEEVGGDAPNAARFRLEKTGAPRSTGTGPDATLFDPLKHLNYTVNIGGGSVSVHDVMTPGVLTTVPLSGGAHPIDASLADSPAGKHWIVTANGAGNSVSLVDRDMIEACIVQSASSCAEAEVLRVPTKPGGEPEGVAYDRGENRIFVVNKFPIGSPSLSVVQLDETSGLGGTETAVIPLGALGASAPFPALIAFDVVVQPRE